MCAPDDHNPRQQEDKSETTQEDGGRYCACGASIPRREERNVAEPNDKQMKDLCESKRKRCEDPMQPTEQLHPSQLQNHGGSEQTGKPVLSACDSAASSEHAMKVAWKSILSVVEGWTCTNK
ncbi:hypothetical protein B0H11DRAFT_1899421 [Mycena galericulata]|nr:hypothetical protein B0H11DRAFT_1899421 [Mycena galericulata]